MLLSISRGSLTRSEALIPGGDRIPLRAFDHFRGALFAVGMFARAPLSAGRVHTCDTPAAMPSGGLRIDDCRPAAATSRC